MIRVDQGATGGKSTRSGLCPECSFGNHVHIGKCGFCRCAAQLSMPPTVADRLRLDQAGPRVDVASAEAVRTHLDYIAGMCGTADKMSVSEDDHTIAIYCASVEVADAWASVFQAAEKGHHLESDLAQPRVHSVTWLVAWHGWHVCIHCSARLAAPTDAGYQRRTELAMAA